MFLLNICFKLSVCTAWWEWKCPEYMAIWRQSCLLCFKSTKNGKADIYDNMKQFTKADHLLTVKWIYSVIVRELSSGVASSFVQYQSNENPFALDAKSTKIFRTIHSKGIVVDWRQRQSEGKNPLLIQTCSPVHMWLRLRRFTKDLQTSLLELTVEFWHNSDSAK